jgi:hypothetical protein
MNGILHEELSRALRNRRLWIVTVLALAALAVGVYRRGLIFSGEAIHPVNLLINILFYTPFSLLAALLATLPFADSFLEDRNQGFLCHILARVPYRAYLAAKSLAVALAGGISVSGSVLLMGAGLVLSGRADFLARGFVSNSSLAPAAPWGPLGWVYAENPYLYLLFLLAAAFAFGAVYALLGLAVSTLINNRYVVLAAPLVYFQVLDYLETRANHIPPAWNPLYTLYPFEAYQGFSLLNLLLQYVVLLAAIALCLELFGRKFRMVS